MIVLGYSCDRECAEAGRDHCARYPVPGSHRLSDPTLTTARHDSYRPIIRLSIYASLLKISVREYTPRRVKTVCSPTKPLRRVLQVTAKYKPLLRIFPILGLPWVYSIASDQFRRTALV